MGGGRSDDETCDTTGEEAKRADWKEEEEEEERDGPARIEVKDKRRGKKKKTA